MEKVKYLSWTLVVVLVMGACGDDSGSTGPEPPPSEVEEASAEKQFVYNAMNYWYYWQGDVAALADDRFDGEQAKQNYLMDFPDAQTLFQELLYVDDDFSFFIEDYEEYNNEQDGIYSALGFNYGFIGFENTDRIVGYVRYVIPGSPADDAELERLELFTEVDGTQLNTGNYLDLLTNDSAHELTLADIEEGQNGVSFPETGTVMIESEQVVEDPVYLSTVIDTNNTNIGYLVYNAFQGNSHQKLNDVMSDFKSQGIDEFVLDLRYNSGGAVITSQLLSSMTSGLGSSELFAEFSYNQKRSQQNREVNFLDVVPLQNEDGEFETDGQGGFVNSEPINTLGLNQLYVLVSSATASASEALINSLLPYIDVTVIGTQTVGKDEGSLTLYDAPEPYLEKEQANSDHKKAIQPIVLKIVNSQGDAYPQGFAPSGSNNVTEITVQNLQAQPELGNPEDPLLARAIVVITGQQTSRTLLKPEANVLQEVEIRTVRTNLRPHGRDMYIEPFMMPTKSSN